MQPQGAGQWFSPCSWGPSLSSSLSLFYHGPGKKSTPRSKDKSRLPESSNPLRRRFLQLLKKRLVMPHEFEARLALHSPPLCLETLGLSKRLDSHRKEHRFKCADTDTVSSGEQLEWVQAALAVLGAAATLVALALAFRRRYLGGPKRRAAPDEWNGAVLDANFLTARLHTRSGGIKTVQKSCINCPKIVDKQCGSNIFETFGWQYVSSAGFPTPTSLASAARIPQTRIFLIAADSPPNPVGTRSTASPTFPKNVF